MKVFGVVVVPGVVKDPPEPVVLPGVVEKLLGAVKVFGVVVVLGVVKDPPEPVVLPGVVE